MNSIQSKLTKQEWINIEIKPNIQELNVLNIIKNYDSNIKHYNGISISNYLKILTNESWDIYLFNLFIKEHLQKINKKLNITLCISTDNTGQPIKNKDIIKINNLSKKIKSHKENIYEFMILSLLKQLSKHTSNIKLMYTLNYLVNLNYTINTILLDYCTRLIQTFDYDIKSLLINYSSCIKNNIYLDRWKCIQLYPHQQTLFDTFKTYTPKLVFYNISTGCGKTLSPIGLVKTHKIIFVCAAKHVGLSLAKAAISQDIKIALAFQCETKNDIRIHYNAASEFLTDNKSGTIKKVNNLKGENIDILICDISSYLISMNYMKEFNDIHKMILFWDEPTISLDYKDHEFHSIIHNNWSQNIIPNIVLSSATLPNIEWLDTMTFNIKNKFKDIDIVEINNYTLDEDVYLLKKNNEVFIPHKDLTYIQLKHFIDTLSCKPLLFKFLPLQFICKFIVSDNLLSFKSIKQKYTDKFKHINDITSHNIREYYTYCCEQLTNEDYLKIHNIHNKTILYKSSILITSKDAHTIDGPTIFLTNQVEKVAKFYFNKSNIDKQSIDILLTHIQDNNKIHIEIKKLQKLFEDIYNKENQNSEKYRLSDELIHLRHKIQDLQSKIKKININDSYIPNKRDHYFKYNNMKLDKQLFTSNLDDETIQKVVLLEHIDPIWKILLLMGIGVFKPHTNIAYTENISSSIASLFNYSLL